MDHFTADTHFSHANILKYCKRIKFLSQHEIDLLNKGINFRVSYESVKLMDDYFIEKINQTVKENDVLWHMGDFSFGTYETALKFRKRIKCKTVNLVFGNHDKYEIGNIFNNAYDKATIEINRRTLVLDHEAHAIWQKSHYGAFHLYGHSHSNAEEWLDKFMPGRRSMDVGVDNALKILGDYRPFSMKEIENIFENRTGCFIDHHQERNKNV